MSSGTPAAREDSALLSIVRPAPRRIGRYDICFELAAGGMATIYLARIEGPGGFKKLCALKCIHPHLVRQASFVEMFLDEARFASRIHHPNVCSVFDFGFADGSYYIAMEFVVGETVSRLCRLAEQHPELLPLPAHAGLVGRIIADAAEGLHAAHECPGDDGQPLNAVHRDVSPQNVMVTYDGAVKVMDFGIARTVDQLHLTRTGTVRGKFPYMAPEQVEQGTIDRRADIWSLGVLYWELLTGKRLFHREREVDTIRAVLSAEIAPPSLVRPGVPREIDEIVLHALARDPRRRFATARDLAQAIEGIRGRRESVVGPGVLGAHLRQLFPDLHARRLELCDQARQMNEGSVPRISRALSEPTVDTRRMVESPLELEAAPRRGLRRAGYAIAALAAAALLIFAERAWLREPQPSVAAEQATPAQPVQPKAAEPHPAVPDRDALARIAEATEATSETDAVPAEGEAAEAAGTATRTVPEREHARRVHGRGFVNVATPGGWADVYVNSRHRGKTPLQLSLPEGRRTVVLRPFGGKPVRRSVLVRRDQLTRLVVSVRRAQD